jgi:hypothetical protein
MGRKRVYAILTAVVLLALSSAACGDTGQGTYSTPRPPSARELAAVETARAEETTEAMQEAARGTADALELERRATQQAIDLRGTQEQAAANATAETWWFIQTQEAANLQATATAESRQATATRQTIDATATTEAHQATSTALQWAANVQGTRAAADAFAVEATRRAVARQDEREATTTKLRAWAGWALLGLAIPALGWLGWRAAQTIEDRARVVRRQAGEGEPIVLVSREQIAMPLRQFNPLLDAKRGQEKSLLLAPTVEAQEGTTMRQQTTNAIQARQAGQIAEAKSKRPKVVNQTIALPAPERTRARRQRRQIPGIIKVVGVNSLEDATREGILPPRLVESIEGEWSDVTED